MALSHEKKKELERGQPYRRELCDLTQLRELKPEYLWRDMQKRRKAVCPEEPTKKSQNLQVLYRKLCGAKTRGTGQKQSPALKIEREGNIKYMLKELITNLVSLC